MTNQSFIEAEETLIIETPERVPLAFALASIGNRFLAVAIDHFIQYLSIIVVSWTFISLTNLNQGGSYGEMFSEMPKWTIALLIIAAFLIFAVILSCLNGFGTDKRRVNGF